MIRQRSIIYAKPGAMNQIVELLKADRTRIGVNYSIFRASLGERDRIAVEFEFANLAELEQFWAGYFADPEFAAFDQEINKLRQRNVTEVWIPVD
jgi:hypothetical protein